MSCIVVRGRLSQLLETPHHFHLRKRCLALPFTLACQADLLQDISAVQAEAACDASAGTLFHSQAEYWQDEQLKLWLTAAVSAC